MFRSLDGKLLRNAVLFVDRLFAALQGSFDRRGSGHESLLASLVMLDGMQGKAGALLA